MTFSIKAILFDIGGTLRVTKPGEGRDLSKVEEIIHSLDETTPVEDFIARIRKGEKSYRRWCKPNYIELNEEELWTRFLLPEYPQEFVRANAIRFNQLWRESRRKYVLPDMADTMRTLASRGYRLGLISNTTSTVEGYQLLEETGLKDLFSCVLLSAEFGRRKPHPSLFIEAARRVEVDPRECAYVGDRPSRDLIGARQANYGAAVIINTEGYTLDEYDSDDYDPEKDSHLGIKADHFIRRLSDLRDIFQPVTEPEPLFSPEVTPFFDVALSTMWHVDQAGSFNAAFEHAKNIGIARFELNHQVTAQHLADFDRDRNYVSTVHDPCPALISPDDLKKNDLLVSSTDEVKRRQGVDIVKRTVALAVNLGSRSVVLHVGSIQCDRSRDRELRVLFNKGLHGTSEYERLKNEMIKHRAEFTPAHMEAVLKSLEEIIAFSRGSNIAIGIENRYRYYDIPLPGEMEKLLAVSDESWYGFQLDTGHAAALERLGLCEKDIWLKKFADRIIGVHLHDVAGIYDHQVPGKGSVDFAALAAYLPEYCQRTMEINPRATPEDLLDGMRLLTKSGCIYQLR